MKIKRAQTLFFSLLLLGFAAAHARDVARAVQLLIGATASPSSSPIAGNLVLVTFETAHVSFSLIFAWSLLSQRLSLQQLSDWSLVQALLTPLSQVLLALTDQLFFSIPKNWAAFNAFSLGVMVLLGNLTPAHSLVQSLVAVPVFTLLSCYGELNKLHASPPGGLLLLVITRAVIIAGAALASWSTAYIVARKHATRMLTLEDNQGSMALRKTPGHRGHVSADSQVDLSPGLTKFRKALQPAPEPASKIKHPLSSQDICQSLHMFSAHAGGPCQRSEPMQKNSAPQQQHHLHQHQQPLQLQRVTLSGRLGDSASHRAPVTASSSKGERPVRAVSCFVTVTPQPGGLPFESFGVRIFGALGLGRMLLRLQDYIDGAADSVPEAIIIRVVCVPIAVYSLWFVLLARRQGKHYSIGNLSPECLLVFMGVWFMIGRDSCSFDVLPALHQIQAQLLSSAATPAAKPSAVELVDSVRRLVAGSSSQGSGASCVLAEVDTLEHLGQGAFGRVYKGVWKSITVAVKVMVLPSHMNGAAKRERMAIMEAAISSALTHPNIVQTYTFSVQPLTASASGSQQLLTSADDTRPASAPEDACGEVYASTGLEVQLVLEYCDGGTLRDALDAGRFLSRHSTTGVQYLTVLQIAREVARGMQHLHSLDIVHADLKTRNILLKSSPTSPGAYTAKVSDFGLSLKMDSQETHISEMYQGTMAYMAPEVLLHGHQSKAADMYSFGICMWELYTAGKPYDRVSKALLGHHVATKGKRPVFPRNAPPEYVALAKRCWGADPMTRLTVDEVAATLSHMYDCAATAHKATTVLPSSIASSTSMPCKHAFQVPRTHGGKQVVGLTDTSVDVFSVMGAAVRLQDCTITHRPGFSFEPEDEALLASGNFRRDPDAALLPPANLEDASTTSTPAVGCADLAFNSAIVLGSEEESIWLGRWQV